MNGFLKEGNLRRWTISAIECYQRGCICKGCEYENLDSGCQMKHTVVELVRRLGLPNGVEGRGIIDDQR